MRRLAISVLVLALVLLHVVPAFAQENTSSPTLVLSTRYPAQVIEPGQNVSISLNLENNGTEPMVVRFEMKEIPEGWKATFRGGGRVIKAVYVEPDRSASVDLRLEQPENVEASTYRFVVVAKSDNAEAELPIELTVQEKLPPKLTFTVDLPTLRGTTTTNFRFKATLKNEGDEDLTVSLRADAPEGFIVAFKPSFGSQEVTSLPVKANSSKNLDIEVKVPRNTPANTYPIRVVAVGGDAEASLDLAVEITGRAELSVTAPEGRLSANAYVGQETPLKVIVQNLGTAPARNVEMNATEPAGWKVEFEPKRFDMIPPGQQVEVTAKIRPADKAVAGDYMVTIRANAEGGVSDSTDFRITVLTSTMWGVVGVGLIAVAVIIVGLAVVRFGRR